MTENGAPAVAAESGTTEAPVAESWVRRLPRVPGFAEWPVEGSPKDEGKALRAGATQ